MTSNSRLIHQWVFPDIHVKTRFVKARECTQVLLIICKGNWQQREHPNGCAPVKRQKCILHLFSSFLNVITAHVCVFLSPCVFTFPLLFGAKGFYNLRKPRCIHSKLHALSHFCLMRPEFILYFPSPHVNSLIIKEHQNWSRENVVEKQRIQGVGGQKWLQYIWQGSLIVFNFFFFGLSWFWQKTECNQGSIWGSCVSSARLTGDNEKLIQAQP